jgi:arginyl-tRNA synthetase
MFTIRSFSDALISLVADLFNVSSADVVACGTTITILDPSSHHTGDLTTNAAMTMARLLKKSPRAIAEQIVTALSTSANVTASIAGPGFINITLAPEAWNIVAHQITAHPTDYFKAEIAQEKSSYLIEYVSANPTGPLHLGHGRNAIIGNVLASALTFAGNTVSTEFYINDAGVQMQKLGASLKARCLELTSIPTEIPEEGYHGQYCGWCPSFLCF